MAILNFELEFRNAPQAAQAAFIGHRAEKRLLPAGTKLYKYSHRGLVNPNGSITPWWSTEQPQVPADPGLAGSEQRAQNLGVSTQEFSRARTAVTKQWNGMTHLLRATLLQPVYGFAGRCSGQLLDENTKNVVFIGGAHQLWIPNLTRLQIGPA